MSGTRERDKARPSGITRRGDMTRRGDTSHLGDTSHRGATMRQVMQYHDGELSALPARQLERRLVWDAHHRRYLDTLDTLGEGVRNAAQQATPALDLTDQIMAQVTLERSGAGAPTTAPTRPPTRLWMAWRRKITVGLGVGLGSTAALAAGALFWLSVRMPSPSETEVTLAARALDRPIASEADAARGAAIESVDFGLGGGSIFMVQAGQTPAPVVWLTEPTEVEVGSEPL